jgi:hypothetical protein
MFTDQIATILIELKYLRIFFKEFTGECEYDCIA